MSALQAVDVKIQNAEEPQVKGPVSGSELETMVATTLIDDLNRQLADISAHLTHQMEQKRQIRGELEELYKLQTGVAGQEYNGKLYVDLFPAEALLLDLADRATPQTDKNGEIVGYRVLESEFKGAVETAVELRKGQLDGLSANNEVTMIQIQSLIEQRKNAMTLLSQLIAAAGEVAKTIIGNMR